MLHTDGLGRTRPQTLATAGATFGIELGTGNPTQCGGKTDRRNLAELAAGTANNALFGQAIIGNADVDFPGGGVEISTDGMRCADATAIAAEGAMAAGEISVGVTTGAGLQQACRTRIDAFAAARAGRQEGRLRQGPRRALGQGHQSGASTKHATTGKIHEYPLKELGPWY